MWGLVRAESHKEQNFSKSVSLLSHVLLFGGMKRTKSRRGRPSTDTGWAWMILVGKSISLDSVEVLKVSQKKVAPNWN